MQINEGNNTLNIQMVKITGNLSGVVSDENTGLVISGVKVTVAGLVAYSDSNGYYEVDGITPGNYTVTFEVSGYQTETR